jgi:hypothetical protein
MRRQSIQSPRHGTGRQPIHAAIEPVNVRRECAPLALPSNTFRFTAGTAQVACNKLPSRQGTLWMDLSDESEQRETQRVKKIFRRIGRISSPGVGLNRSYQSTRRPSSSVPFDRTPPSLSADAVVAAHATAVPDGPRVVRLVRLGSAAEEHGLQGILQNRSHSKGYRLHKL